MRQQKKIFDKLTKEIDLNLDLIENLSFNTHHSSKIEANFALISKAISTAELLFDAINTMELFSCYGFYFSGHSQDSFTLISNKVGKAMGGISNVFLEADSKLALQSYINSKNITYE